MCNFPWHDRIMKLPAPTINLSIPPKKKMPSICHENLFLEKGPPILFDGGDTMDLIHQQIMWWYVFPQYLHRSRLKLT